MSDEPGRPQRALSDDVVRDIAAAGGDLRRLCGIVLRQFAPGPRSALYLSADLPGGIEVQTLASAFGDGADPNPVADTVPRAGTMLEAARRAGRAVVLQASGRQVPDHLPDGYRALTERYPVGSLVVAPLRVGDRDVGFLCLTRPPDVAPFARADADRLDALAAAVALAAEHRSLLDAARRNELRQRSLAAIGDRGSSRMELADLFGFVVDVVRIAVDADVAAVFAVEAGEASATLRAVAGLDAEPAAPARIALDDRDAELRRDRDVIVRAGSWGAVGPVLGEVRASMSVMLHAPRPTALLLVGRRARRRFTDGDERFLGAVGQLLTRILETRATHDRLREQALVDGLTGLPNRNQLGARLVEALELARASGQPVALLLADLDGFKLVNDSLGHRAGDELLRHVGARLRSLVRPSDLVVRLGGDEFAVLCPDTGQLAAYAVAQRILDALRDPVDVGFSRVVPHASVGVAVFDPVTTAHLTHDDLLPQADLAMYRAKAGGRHRIALYDAAMHIDVERRMQIEQGLRAAIGSDQLLLHYQPVVRLATGRLGGLEALVRWQHPTLGPVRPDHFVPIAEESGLVCELDAWVLRQAARQTAAWLDEGLLVPGQAVSVNVSARDLMDAMFSERFASIVSDTGCPPSSLYVEVTESLLTDAVGANALRGLKALGVRIALDDYGTGFSSLGQLKRVPVDVVKIDRTFVANLLTDPVDATIVSSTVNLAHALAKLVVAEGIETDEQLHALAALGCDAGQGYLIARPAPVAEATDLLRDGLSLDAAHPRSE